MMYIKISPTHQTGPLAIIHYHIRQRNILYELPTLFWEMCTKRTDIHGGRVRYNCKSVCSVSSGIHGNQTKQRRMLFVTLTTLTRTTVRPDDWDIRPPFYTELRLSPPKILPCLRDCFPAITVSPPRIMPLSFFLNISVCFVRFEGSVRLSCNSRSRYTIQVNSQSN